MKKSPTLSILTLTKNRTQLLRQHLKSLVRQTKPQDEIIIIDNGSTDQTQQVLSEFATILPLRVFRLTSGNFPVLYNNALAHAKNDIVVFLDDDCIARPDFLSHIRNAHRKRPNAVIQGMTFSKPKGNIYADIMGDHYQHFLHVNTLPNGTLRILDNKNASVPRSLLRTIGGFRESLALGSEDIELGIRLRQRGFPITLDSSIIAYHHERETLREFLRQHLRFARSEGYLDAYLPMTERIGLISFPKLILQLRGAVRRELLYLGRNKFKEALLLPVIYFLLGIVRIVGYSFSL